MAVESRSSFPTQLTAGDTLSVTLALSDYSAADGWTAKATLIPDDYENHMSTTYTSTADGADHAFVIAKAATATLQAGEYRLVIFAESATERETVSTQYIKILPDPTTADRTTADWAVRVLHNLETAYEQLTQGGLKTTSVAINGKSYTRTNLIELRQEMSYWRNKVNQLRRMEQGCNPWQGYQVRM